MVMSIASAVVGVLAISLRSTLARWQHDIWSFVGMSSSEEGWETIYLVAGLFLIAGGVMGAVLSA